MNKEKKEYFTPFQKFADTTLKLELIVSNLISKAFRTETIISRKHKNQKELDKIAFNYYKSTKNIPYYSKSKWFSLTGEFRKADLQESKTKSDLDKQYEIMKKDCEKGYENLCLIEDRVKKDIKSYLKSECSEKDMDSLFKTYIEAYKDIDDIYYKINKPHYIYENNLNHGFFHTTEETIKPHEQKR